MPTVPPNLIEAKSSSPIGQPTPANLLMAAAEMHSKGRLVEIPQKVKPKPLKVVK